MTSVICQTVNQFLLPDGEISGDPLSDNDLVDKSADVFFLQRMKATPFSMFDNVTKRSAYS